MASHLGPNIVHASTLKYFQTLTMPRTCCPAPYLASEANERALLSLIGRLPVDLYGRKITGARAVVEYHLGRDRAAKRCLTRTNGKQQNSIACTDAPNAVNVVAMYAKVWCTYSIGVRVPRKSRGMTLLFSSAFCASGEKSFLVCCFKGIWLAPYNGRRGSEESVTLPPLPSYMPSTTGVCTPAEHFACVQMIYGGLFCRRNVTSQIPFLIRVNTPRQP